ncbi:MAG: hypothetical protein WBM02_11880 [bacterium]
MRKLIFAMCLVNLILFIGCGNSEISSTGRYSGEIDTEGNFYILDTKTGKVEVVKNELLVEIPKEKEVVQIKEYRSTQIPGTPIQITGLRLRYRDQKLFYRGYLKPVTEQLMGDHVVIGNQTMLFEKMEALWEEDSYYNSRQITIKLIDSDGFDIADIELKRRHLTKIVDDDLNPAMLSFQGSIPVQPKDFMSISGYTFSWNLADWK